MPFSLDGSCVFHAIRIVFGGFDLIFDIAFRCAHCFCFVILLFYALHLCLSQSLTSSFSLRYIRLIAKPAHPSFRTMIYTFEAKRNKKNAHKIISFHFIEFKMHEKSFESSQNCNVRQAQMLLFNASIFLLCILISEKKRTDNWTKSGKKHIHTHITNKFIGVYNVLKSIWIHRLQYTIRRYIVGCINKLLLTLRHTDVAVNVRS